VGTRTRVVVGTRIPAAAGIPAPVAVDTRKQRAADTRAVAVVILTPAAATPIRAVVGTSLKVTAKGWGQEPALRASQV
jgi:hypothetical protein